jgi:hypothetical protein
MRPKRETYIDPKDVKLMNYPAPYEAGPPSYPATIITSRELIERLALDLVEMHNDTGINLEYWPAARELVTRFYVGEAPIKPGREWNEN